MYKTGAIEGIIFIKPIPFCNQPRRELRLWLGRLKVNRTDGKFVQRITGHTGRTDRTRPPFTAASWSLMAGNHINTNTDDNAYG